MSRAEVKKKIRSQSSVGSTLEGDGGLSDVDMALRDDVVDCAPFGAVSVTARFN